MNDLTPNEVQFLRQMIPVLKRYRGKVGVIPPLTLVEGIDGQKIGIDNSVLSSSGGDLCDYSITGLVGSTAGTPAGGSYSQNLGNKTKIVNDGGLFVNGGYSVPTFVSGGTHTVHLSGRHTYNSIAQNTDPSGIGVDFRLATSTVGSTGTAIYTTTFFGYGPTAYTMQYGTLPSDPSTADFPYYVATYYGLSRSSTGSTSRFILWGREYGGMQYCAAAPGSIAGTGAMFLGATTGIGLSGIPAGSIINVCGGLVYDWVAPASPPISPPPPVSPPVSPPITSPISPPPLVVSPPPPPPITGIANLRAGPLSFGKQLLDSTDRAAAKKRLNYSFDDLTTSTDPPGTVPSFAAGTTNDYQLPAGATVYINVNLGASTVTGFVAGTSGSRKRIFVVGTETLTVQHQDAGSSAANRVVIAGGANVTYADGDGFELEYDGTNSRWRIPY